MLDPNLERKSFKSPIWSRFFKGPNLHRTIFKILKDVLDGMLSFAVPNPLEKLPKSFQLWKNRIPESIIFKQFFNVLFTELYWFGAAFVLENRS